MASVPLNYYDFLETFPLAGCAVCNLCQHDVERFIDAHLYEYANEPETHDSFRASRGLCAVHSAQMVEYGASVLGIAILQSHVLDELLKITATPAASSAFSRWFNSGGSTLADRLEPAEQCAACEVLAHTEQGHVRALAVHIDDARLQAAYRASQGLCLPHFRMVLRAAPDANKLETLVSIQTVLWARLKAELDRFADNYDIHHADRTMGAEGDSWRRAIPLLAGVPSLFGTRIR